MKKTKLLSSLLALTLVLGVGGCDDISSSEECPTCPVCEEGTGESGGTSGEQEPGESGGTSGEQEGAEVAVLSDILGKNSLTGDLLYEGKTVTIENCVVTGIHGTTLTVQQKVSSSIWDTSTYSIEVLCSSLPEELSLLMGVSVTGVVGLTHSTRVVLKDASVVITDSSEQSYYTLDLGNYYYMWDAMSYYYYSGSLADYYFEFCYEATDYSLSYLISQFGITEDIYKAYYVIAYSDDICTYDVMDGYVIIYNDVDSETKAKYDEFFSGLQYGDYFKATTKLQLCVSENYYYSYGYFMFNFDAFELKTLASHEVKQIVYTVMMGKFDSQTVTIDGVLMDKHGKMLTIQNQDYEGLPYCIEVELANENDADDLTLCTYISVTGTVDADYSWWDEAYIWDEPMRRIKNATATTIDPNDQSFSYWANSEYLLGYGYSLYNGNFFDLTFQVIDLPESWDKSGTDDLVVWTKVTYYYNYYYAYIPVVVYGDASEEVKNFWHAFFYGCESATSISYPLLNSDGSKIDPDYVLPAGHPGCPVNSTFETHFAESITDYSTTVPEAAGGEGGTTVYLTGACALGQLAGVYMVSYASSAAAAG